MCKKYNGWANYQTWKVMLEVLDGYDFGGITFDSIDSLADALRDIVDDAITADTTSETLAVSWARSFVSDVNYEEIASSMVEDDPRLMSEQVEEDYLSQFDPEA